MNYLAVLKFFESLSLDRQISTLEGLLLNAGFNEERVESRRKNQNFFYSKEDVDTVFVSIFSKKNNVVAYAVMDKDIYDKEFRGTGKVLMLKCRADNKFKIICSSGGWNNASLHHIVMGKIDGVQIDHISHNTFINTRECLRPCYAYENAFNKPFYSHVDGLRFRIRDKVISLIERQMLINEGYKFKGNYIYSPQFSSKVDMYAEIKQVETKYLMQFRYNPVLDYTETWYAYVIFKMLGLMTKKELDMYVIDYIKRNHPKTAEYYQL